MKKNERLISIIIPVKNGQRHLPGLMKSLNALKHSDFEIIFVNDGSTDSTGELLAGYNNVKVITTDGVGPSAARNLALKDANGRYAAFTDADCLVHPDWLDELLKGFSDERIAAVGGDQQSPSDELKFGVLVQRFLKTIGFTAEYVKNKESRITGTKHNPTCNAMYLKEVLLNAGGFRENFWPGEDLEIDYRLSRDGWRFNYNPRAVVYHYRPDTFKRFIKMMFAYGWAQGVLVRDYGPFRFVHYVPFCIIIFIGLMLGIDITIAVNVLHSMLAIIYLFMLIETQSLIKAVQFSVLLISTLITWTAGFFKGIIKGCMF